MGARGHTLGRQLGWDSDANPSAATSIATTGTFIETGRREWSLQINCATEGLAVTGNPPHSCADRPCRAETGAVEATTRHERIDQAAERLLPVTGHVIRATDPRTERDRHCRSRDTAIKESVTASLRIDHLAMKPFRSTAHLAMGSVPPHNRLDHRQGVSSISQRVRLPVIVP